MGNILTLINNNNIVINRFRFFHSANYFSNRFEKLRNYYNNNGDLIGERNLIKNYLIQKNEIFYTQYVIFFIASIVLFIASFFILLMSINNYIGLITLFTSFLLYILSKNRKQKILLNTGSIEFSDSYYNNQIYGHKNKP